MKIGNILSKFFVFSQILLNLYLGNRLRKANTPYAYLNRNSLHINLKFLILLNIFKFVIKHELKKVISGNCFSK